MNPFPMIERAVLEMVQTYPPALGKAGGDPDFQPGTDLYVMIGLVGGATDEVEGDWAVDIDCFSSSYAGAMDAALALEATLLGRRLWRTETMLLDRVTQNEAPAERPWEDESTYRVGATYSFVARRSG